MQRHRDKDTDTQIDRNTHGDRVRQTHISKKQHIHLQVLAQLAQTDRQMDRHRHSHAGYRQRVVRIQADKYAERQTDK